MKTSADTLKRRRSLKPLEQKRMMECVQELRKLGPIAGMEDPVAWQRSIREDRDLCHGK